MEFNGRVRVAATLTVAGLALAGCTGWSTGPTDTTSTGATPPAGAGIQATVEVGRPLSSADTRDTPISRDAGFSAAYSATESLWIFGDTTQGPGGWFQLGTTAAVGPYARGQAPMHLRELPTPPAAPTPDPARPALFLPAPQGLLTTVTDAQGAAEVVPCASTGRGYPASWTSGTTRIPDTSTLLIVVHEVCVQDDKPTWPAARIKLVVYDPATNRFTSAVTPFAASPSWVGVPAEQLLGSPVFGGDGFLYLYGSDVHTNRVFVARVPADWGAWGRPADYEWWGSPDLGPPRWTAVQSSAVSVGAIATPWTVHVADYAGAGDHRLAMIVQDVFRDGGYTVYEATSPTGPWASVASGRVPDSCGPGFGCYAFTGHPELSTATEFMLSWYSPRDRNGRGHIRLGTVNW